MRAEDFSYHLPERLIADFPSPVRTDSRLLSLDVLTGHLNHLRFNQLPGLLQKDDLLVFNNTRVIPARMFGIKASGGKVEVLVERLLGRDEVLAQVRASKTPQNGSVLFLDKEKAQEHSTGNQQAVQAIVIGREGEFFRLRLCTAEPVLDVLHRIGHIPLPPYIKRPDQALDRERYQTVYGTVPGAVAAPTAGLHFDTDLILKLKKQGVETTYITLHVGAGTFQPVRVENIAQHKMHKEFVQVSEQACAAVKRCKARNGRVIAVGTTAVRSLETAALHSEGELRPFQGETDIFIYPGFTFKVVDAMITNFHLPGSTLLMLVSAFAGREMILATYNEAVKQNYRFFSYGDAMFLQRGGKVLL